MKDLSKLMGENPMTKIVVIIGGNEGVGKHTLVDVLYRSFGIVQVNGPVPMDELAHEYHEFLRGNFNLMVVIMNDPGEIKTFVDMVITPCYILQIKRKGVNDDIPCPIEGLGLINVYNNDYDLKTSKNGFLSVIECFYEAAAYRENELRKKYEDLKLIARKVENL